MITPAPHEPLGPRSRALLRRIGDAGADGLLAAEAFDEGLIGYSRLYERGFVVVSTERDGGKRLHLTEAGALELSYVLPARLPPDARA